MFSLLKYFTLSINLYETPNNYNKKSLSSLITTENRLQKIDGKNFKNFASEKFFAAVLSFFHLTAANVMKRKSTAYDVCTANFIIISRFIEIESDSFFFCIMMSCYF